MLDNAVVMFQDMGTILTGLKKKTYENYMDVFREKYKDYFNEIIDYVDTSEDKMEAAKALGLCLASQVEAEFKKRRKVPTKIQMNLNLIMIYYIFPGILMTKNENAVLIADSFRDEWNKTFGCNINYTTFEEIYAGFKNRIFGFEIG